MDFDFSEDQKVLQDEGRKFLTEQCPLSRVREVFEGTDAYDQKLWSEMGELGWLGASIPEQYGGSGMGQLEVAVLAEEVGRALAPVPFSSSVYRVVDALMLAGSEEQKQRYLPGLASGELIGCFASQESLNKRHTLECSTRIEGGKLSGKKSPVLDGDIADIAVVTCCEEGQLTLAIVDLRVSGVQRRSLQSLDQSRSQACIEFNSVPAERLGQKKQGQEQEVLFNQLIDRAAVLVSFEQLGGAQRCLDIAKEFALQRYAFGRSVASFQAVKHKLADMYVANELAQANAYYGAWALENDSDEIGIAAAVARISACEAFDSAAEDTLHVHGGAGFTWEYDCHLFIRRAKLLSFSLGSVRSWKSKLIDRVRDIKR